MKTENLLKEVKTIFDNELKQKSVAKILKLLGANFPTDLLSELKLYSDFLPKAHEVPFTPRQRYLHFLWDTLDKLPISIMANFAIPFRRMIAERLFKKCGKNFIADENVRFNFGQNIEVGDDVFMNRGSYLDSKGGIKIGNSVGLAEEIIIFTHTHSESDHAIRTYAPVVIQDYAKIYTQSMILPGVTIGKEAIVAAKSMVTANVEAGTLVAGIPAKLIRERKTEGRKGAQLNHIWLHNGVFQSIK